MKWLYALAMPGAMCAAAIGDDKPAEGKHMEDVARGYVDAFLQGNAQVLLDHASPELRALEKTLPRLNSLRKNTVGARPVSADEQISVEYVRLVKSAAGQTWSVAATVAPDGTLAGFLVTPAGEAPSTFLNYKTKAHARLPFAGTWTVFWGGRSIKDNYHAAYPDQRFAYDIVMMKDGKTHPGNGAKERRLLLLWANDCFAGRGFGGGGHGRHCRQQAGQDEFREADRQPHRARLGQRRIHVPVSFPKREHQSEAGRPREAGTTAGTVRQQRQLVGAAFAHPFANHAEIRRRQRAAAAIPALRGRRQSRQSGRANQRTADSRRCRRVVCVG